MTEPTITPQEPGVIAGVDQSKLDAIADGTVGDLAEALPSLTDVELDQLHTIEAAGKNRKSALQAIHDEQTARGEVNAAAAPAEDNGKAKLGDDASYANKRGHEVDPRGLARPVLTMDGWVLPLPQAQAEG